METLNNVELVMFAPRKKTEPPTVAALREALAARRFNVEHAEDVPLTTAFRRAVTAAKPDADGGAAYKITCAEGSSNKTFAQIDALEPDESTGKINRRRIAGWILHQEQDKTYRVETTAGTGTPPVEEHRARYTWADLTAIARRIMDKDADGSYSPRPNGGVYFVPCADRSFLDRLETAFGVCNFSVLRYVVPDTAAQREEIASTIGDHMAAEIDEHETAVGAYNAETRPGIIENRRKAIEATANTLSKVTRTIQIGEARRLALMARINELLQRTEAAHTAATTQREENRGAARGQRRIVTATATV